MELTSVPRDDRRTPRRGDRRRRAWALLGALVATGAALAGFASSGHAQSKSFRLVSLDTTAQLRPDGSMTVREDVVYDFDGGPFTIGVRSFDPASRPLVRDVTVTEDGQRLVVDPPDTTPTGEWEWHFASPVTDDTRTFTISYTVDAALVVGPDVGELYWQFLGDDHPGVGRMRIAVELPGDAPPATESTADDDASVVRAWGHGPATGVVTLDPGVVRAVVPDVPAGQYVELRILVPTSELTVEPFTGPRLAQVLEEERSYLDDRDREQRKRTIGQWASWIAAAAGLLGTGALWWRFGREPTPDLLIGDYWREPLEDPPAIVLTNLRRGSVPIGPAIGATLIDLAQRGYLRITAQREERFGPDRTDHTIHWQGRELGPDVLTYERTLVSMVLRGQTQMSIDELNAWGRAHRTTASKQLERLKEQIGTEFKRRGYRPTAPPRATGLVVALAVAVGAVGAIARWLGSGWGWLAIGLAPVVLLGGGYLVTNRPPKAATEVAKAEAMRRFLRDFSNLEDAPVGHLILWERYLVWAVTLGVSAELLRGLSARLPTVANDPAFAVWYVGATTRFDHLGDLGGVGSSISSSFAPPSNSSGGGGGFSGGGGGGGGGGGFGAR